ncbi:MAG: fibronectin type III-like domain-contianing protein [Lachnospiraceae bacterium]
MLRGFTRVELQAGEEKLVTIACPLEKLAYYDPYTRQMTVEKMEYELYIGTSEADWRPDKRKRTDLTKFGRVCKKAGVILTENIDSCFLHYKENLR